MNKFFGIALVLIAIAIAVVPHYTDCQSQGRILTTADGKQVSMKCHWSGVAEIGVAVPLAFVGGILSFSRRRSSLLSLGILGAVLGAVAITFPGGLIGTCTMPTMICNTTMKPALYVLGGLTIVGGLGSIFISRKAKE
jgi:hypothetical protein